MDLRKHLLEGHVIPAHPLALDEHRRLDERHQRALTRYYVDAGAGGIAVGVHTTQFAIREPKYGLYRPVLELASETVDLMLENSPRPFAKVAGICGRTEQAVQEAEIARSLDYDAGLLSLGAWAKDKDDAVLAHSREVAEVIPLFGFYLQPAVGGRILSYSFWRRFLEIENLVAIKIAPFDRYQTLDVVRAVAESGREDVALYTGNDDNIIPDLLTPFEFTVNGQRLSRRIVGGLLGQWAVWTHAAVQMLNQIKSEREKATIDAAWLTRSVALTDANAVIFDAANNFAGCIPGIHEVLRRQGLLKGTWCLDPDERLSTGQADDVSRILGAYPNLRDDGFVQDNLERWLS